MTQLTTALEFGESEGRTHASSVRSSAELGKSAVSRFRDDLAREVYGILGLPIDAVEMADVVRQIDDAATVGAPFLMSTPNLNFVIGCQTDAEFRNSVLKSDLCTADGMPVVWIARMLGLPIRSRVAGSDVFEALKIARGANRKLKLFLFGGDDGVAARACAALANEQNGGLRCVGFHYPGFGSIDDMSTAEIVEKINASEADILAVSLGAQKGQAWLLRNHDRLRTPVRSHLGATINFQAGTVKRSPVILRRFGLEWLWRIKEEPSLWRRYCGDGYALLRIMLAQVFPILASNAWRKLTSRGTKPHFSVSRSDAAELITLRLHGNATASFVPVAIDYFRSSIGKKRLVTIDFSETREIDARFIGCLLMLRKQLDRHSQSLEFVGMSPRIRGIFRRNGFEYLFTVSA